MVYPFKKVIITRLDRESRSKDYEEGLIFLGPKNFFNAKV